jgi:hypothetical protein
LIGVGGGSSLYCHRASSLCAQAAVSRVEMPDFQFSRAVHGCLSPHHSSPNPCRKPQQPTKISQRQPRASNQIPSGDAQSTRDKHAASPDRPREEESVEIESLKPQASRRLEREPHLERASAGLARDEAAQTRARARARARERP